MEPSTIIFIINPTTNLEFLRQRIPHNFKGKFIIKSV